MTVSLSERMGTRYMINSLNMRFITTMNALVDEGVEVDLAGCRFGPECASLLRKYYGSIWMCNSEDKDLDILLKSNCEFARSSLEPYEVLDLTDVCDINGYIRLVNELPKNSKYSVKLDLTSIVNRAVLVLLILTRPDIMFDLTECSDDVFDYVREIWVSSAKHHEEYIECVAPYCVRRKQNEDGFYGDAINGYVREEYFVRHNKVLPVEFGNSQIVVLDKNVGVDEEWHPVVEKCLKAFEKTKSAERTPGKVLINFLNFREE